MIFGTYWVCKTRWPTVAEQIRGNPHTTQQKILRSTLGG